MIKFPSFLGVDGSTDKASYRDAWMHLKNKVMTVIVTYTHVTVVKHVTQNVKNERETQLIRS